MTKLSIDERLTFLVFSQKTIRTLVTLATFFFPLKIVRKIRVKISRKA